MTNIDILGLGVKVPPKSSDWVKMEILRRTVTDDLTMKYPLGPSTAVKVHLALEASFDNNKRG